MADPQMGDELIETLQVFFDAGGDAAKRRDGFTSPTGRSPIASNEPRTSLATASRATPAAGSTWH